MPNDDQDNWSDWRRILYSAKVKAIDSLTPEMAAEADRERKEWSEIYKAKRAARTAEKTKLFDWLMSGKTVDEISAKTGIDRSKVYRKYKRAGMKISDRKGYRRMMLWISESDLPTVDALAKKTLAARDRTRENLLKKLLKIVLADDGFNAEWLLKQSTKENK